MNPNQQPQPALRSKNFLPLYAWAICRENDDHFSFIIPDYRCLVSQSRETAAVGFT